MFFQNILRGWLFRDWFFFDVVLGIIYFILFLVIAFWLFLTIKKRRFGKGSFKRAGIFLSLLLIFYFVIGSLALLTFSGAGRHVEVNSEAPTVTMNKNGKSIIVNKVRARIPNGHSNGVSTSTSTFEFIAVNSGTGKKEWTKKSTWQDYVIGQTKDDMIIMNPKKKQLSFIDMMTGKKSLSEDELYQKLPKLKGNLSFEMTDYFIENKKNMYLYGLDNQYYKIDLEKFTLNKSDNYKTILEEHTFESPFFLKGRFLANEISEDDQQLINDALKEINSRFINLSILAYDPKNSVAYISYSPKRNDPSLTISKVKIPNKKIIWSTSIQAGDESSGFMEENNMYFQTNGYLYKISLENGKILFKYSYLWNKSID
ncbi:hypothetical protein J6TS2_27520 [Heyndrickxia sporothermodurans]|nr:hypothetical protein J6TS2_27520 [Heyndrickxia sporothermodurans]